MGVDLLLVAGGIALASQPWALAAPFSAGLLTLGALLAALEIGMLLREDRRT